MAVAGAVLAPSSPDLHGLYGNPDVERFSARPGIGVTVQYGSDQQVCQAIIEPPQQLLHGDDEQVPLMSSEAVTDILDVISPADERGAQLNRILTFSGCNEFLILEYENVSIRRSTHNCLPLRPENEMRATVEFKRSACPRRIPVKPPAAGGGDATGAPPSPPDRQ
ncbi:MAG: hypothetical protein WCA00_12730 [Candidatus Acidiferrales bacterium]